MYDTLRNVALAASAVTPFLRSLRRQPDGAGGGACRPCEPCSARCCGFSSVSMPRDSSPPRSFSCGFPECSRRPKRRWSRNFPVTPRRPATRLAANPRLKGFHSVGPRRDRERPASLGRECDVIIRTARPPSFASTAISQSGRLDTVFVLTAHVRMVWRIAIHTTSDRRSGSSSASTPTLPPRPSWRVSWTRRRSAQQIEPILSSALGAVQPLRAGCTGRGLHRGHLDPHGGRQRLPHPARGDYRQKVVC